MTSRRMPALLTSAVLAAAFERIGGFGALHKGLRIEVDAQRTSDGLVAKQIEPQGGGGGRADDGPNHT